jgi:hypothetical protein
VDKGHYWPPEYLPMNETEGSAQLFMNGAAIISDDSTVTLVAGQTWGGGGSVNWSASLQPQGYVRQEWAYDGGNPGGLPFFTSSAYQAALDRVCDVMGVSTRFIEHSMPNAYLLEGARRLGWSHKEVPQNTGRKSHSCGHCSMGCASCGKQGPAQCWLPKAAAAGATFMEGFECEKVLFGKKKSEEGKQVATGVLGTWRSRDAHGGVAGRPVLTRKVMIKANRVVVSCGTMQSPLLLLRSGLTNYHIGRNLHVHPVCLLGAVYDEPTNPWDGPILTAVVSEFENLDGHGHGTKLESTTMLPSFWMCFPNWTTGLEYKKLAAKMRYMTGYIAIARDKDTGQVYPDPVDGRVRFKYHPSKLDKSHIMEGLVALAKISYVNGAREIFAIVPGMPSFIRTETSSAESRETSLEGPDHDESFQAWLAQLRRHGFPSESWFITAHQMGTCRMSASPKTGVVDAKGRVYGTEGLYVVDASIFPSASGVNPMVSNMGMAEYLSKMMNRDWGAEKEVEAKL